MSHLQLLMGRLRVLALGTPSAWWIIVLLVAMRQPQMWTVLNQIAGRLKELRFFWFHMTFFDRVASADDSAVDKTSATKPRTQVKRRNRSKSQSTKHEESRAADTSPDGGQP